MKPRYWLCLLLLFADALAAQRAPARSAAPDIFLITIDTLRADHVRCFGYDKVQTPTLDLLAAAGIRFSHAFTPSPITNTSHVSIMTGLLPSSHGVTDFAVPLAPSHTTLAEALKRNSYHTGAFIGAVILDSKTLAPGLNRGFDFYDNFPEKTSSSARWGRVERRGAEVIQHAESWLSANRTGPHFVWVHLYDPHDPYEPPPPFAQTYKDRLYDGEIAYADSVLAGFLGFLKQQGWYDNALIVVTGDHGEGLGEHGEQTHGIFLYDSPTRVPMIIKLPKSATVGLVADAQVRTTDLMPTILDIAGIAPPPSLDGESLRPLFKTPSTASRTAIGETDYPLRFGWAPLRSVRADGFKFIEAPRPELYDLHSDPGELNNTYQPWNETVQRLRRVLADERAKRPPAATQATVLPATLEELRALGYLGPLDAVSATSVPEPSLLPDPKDKIEEQNLLHTAMMASDDGRSRDARTALEKVLQMDPKSPTALRQLGELELQARDFDTAAEHLGRARAVRPDDATAAYEHGQALFEAGKFGDARDALEASLKLAPGQLPPRLLLGQTYLNLKQAAAAEDQFEAALLIDPHSSKAQLGLANSHILAKDFATAAASLEKLVIAEPRNAEVFRALAAAYAALGRSADAQSAAEKAASLAK
ncbi:MAG: sulfatase-like hydrolase/transferase [Acidobacteriales bacterium]|nr:sulfatase-like hydrolase/transferase [Terriglobales bacterium]